MLIVLRESAVKPAMEAKDLGTRISFGTPPSIGAVAAEMKIDSESVAASFRRLAEAHILVLQRDSGEILMANPYSAVPTPFLVQTPRYDAYGNCIWDALGIAAMLRADV